MYMYVYIYIYTYIPLSLSLPLSIYNHLIGLKNNSFNTCFRYFSTQPSDFRPQDLVLGSFFCVEFDFLV